MSIRGYPSFPFSTLEILAPKGRSRKMDKHKRLAARLKKLEDLAFQRALILKEVVTTVNEIASEEDAPWADHLLNLLATPLTLWGTDHKGLAEHICEMIASGLQPTVQMKKILSNYGELPSDDLVRVISEDEHEVQDGNYNQYLKAASLAKYDAANKLMLANPEVHADVADFFLRNPEFGLGKKVIRRRMCMERNFRQPGWEYKGKNRDAKNLTLMEFDSLCFKHMLYGVERQETGFAPLLQKLSVNATPFGVMIFIPRYWSFDPQRDVKWSELNRALKAWGIKRQGIKWSTSRLETLKVAKLTLAAFEEATALGKIGKARYDHTKEKAGLNPDMDDKSVNRLLKEATKMVNGKKSPKEGVNR